MQSDHQTLSLPRLSPIALLIPGCLLFLSSVLAEEQQALPSSIELVKELRYRDLPQASDTGVSRQSWTLDLAQARHRTAALRPAVIVIHGGGWIEGDKSSFSSPEHPVPGNIVDFARLGFVAVTINYRLSREAPWPAALEDCQCAVRWLRAHAAENHVDPKRIAAYGNSAGGHLAMMLGMTDADPGSNAVHSNDVIKTSRLNCGGLPDEQSGVVDNARVQAVISDSGPIDLLAQHQQGTLRRVVEMFLGGRPEATRAESYRTASPSSHVNAGMPPMLLIYGVADEQIPIESADDFVQSMHAAGNADVSYYRLAATGHCPHSIQRVPWLQPVVSQFLIRVLKPEAPNEMR